MPSDAIALSAVRGRGKDHFGCFLLRRGKVWASGGLVSQMAVWRSAVDEWVLEVYVRLHVEYHL